MTNKNPEEQKFTAKNDLVEVFRREMTLRHRAVIEEHLKQPLEVGRFYDLWCAVGYFLFGAGFSDKGFLSDKEWEKLLRYTRYWTEVWNA